MKSSLLKLLTFALVFVMVSCSSAPQKKASSSSARASTYEKQPIQVSQNYYLNVRQYIASRVQYPQSSINANQQGTAIVSVIFLRNGWIKNARIIKSSGHRLLDQEALGVFNRIKSFPPPNDSTADVKEFKLILPISFTLS